MNHFTALHQSTLQPRIAAALVAIGMVITISVRPVVGEVPADVKRAADTLISTGISKPPASTMPSATPTSLPTALTDIGSDDASKLQAARIRYGRLAQNFPDQFANFEARVKEIDQRLRQSLPVPCEIGPVFITATVPLTSVDSGDLVVTPQRPGTAIPSNATATGSLPALTPTAEPWSIDMRVEDLKDLANRLQMKAASVRDLSEQTENGVTVPLHPDAEARLRVLYDLLRKTELTTDGAVQR